MEEEGARRENDTEIPFFQRLYDRPFVLLALGMGIMFVVFTAWGLWEVLSLPEATLP